MISLLSISCHRGRSARNIAVVPREIIQKKNGAFRAPNALKVSRLTYDLVPILTRFRDLLATRSQFPLQLFQLFPCRASLGGGSIVGQMNRFGRVWIDRVRWKFEENIFTHMGGQVHDVPGDFLHQNREILNIDRQIKGSEGADAGGPDRGTKTAPDEDPAAVQRRFQVVMNGLFEAIKGVFDLQFGGVFI